MIARSERLSYLDGLRGIAVLLVLVYHAWVHLIALAPSHTETATTAWYFAGFLGDEGVGLFLVLSGFCLAIGPLRRRARGEPEWFSAREFFARRCLRILPPYYVALIASIAVLAACESQHWPAFGSDDGYGLAAGSIVAHALLIHNLTGHTFSLNSAFWSLGLEWQWYWAFPFVLVGAVRYPRLTLGLSALLALVWLMGVAWLVVSHHGQTLPPFEISQMRALLPMRLFEFTSGLCAAQLVVRSDPASRAGALLPLTAGVLFVVTLVARPLVARYQMTGLLSGAGFAGVIAVTARSSSLARALAWRPLAGAGTVSYSVYLLHWPAMQAVEFALPRSTPGVAVAIAGIFGGVLAGLALHMSVERWSMRQSTRERWEPLLMRGRAWTDALPGGRPGKRPGHQDAVRLPA